MLGRVLIVDDELAMCKLLEADLGMRDFEATWFTAPEEALQSLKNKPCDIVLTDLNMPGMSGTVLCERIVANHPDVPVIVMTAFGSMETAVAAIRAGAYDFVTKPIEMDMLALTLERAIRHRELQEKVKLLSDAVAFSKRFENIIGESPVMRELFDQLGRIADSESAVLITGESGTGKELVARAIHGRSHRANKPFVAINCAAISENLLESELFGHEKGAFTDAHTDRKGLFLHAEGGTLLLDEVGDMPLSMQPKLLRAIEENKVRPVGGNSEIAFDARVITATNRDLDTAVVEQRFREDLFFRINVIQLQLPPLRSRGTDVLLLAQHFVEIFADRSGKEITGISESAAHKLLSYDWPGNVRELRNVMERAVALTRYDKLAIEDLSEKIRNYRRSHVVIGSTDPNELIPMEEVERRYILHVLESTRGNKTLAARILGLDRKTLYRKLQQYGATQD